MTGADGDGRMEHLGDQLLPWHGTLCRRVQVGVHQLRGSMRVMRWKWDMTHCSLGRGQAVAQLAASTTDCKGAWRDLKRLRGDLRMAACIAWGCVHLEVCVRRQGIVTGAPQENHRHLLQGHQRQVHQREGVPVHWILHCAARPAATTIDQCTG